MFLTKYPPVPEVITSVTITEIDNVSPTCDVNVGKTHDYGDTARMIYCQGVMFVLDK